MADEPTKVSAREVLGTAWEAGRKCKPVDESDIRIEVYYVNPDRSQQELAPLDGRADTDEIGKLYGNGRFFLRAKKKTDNTVISQTTADIKNAEPHPMDVAAANAAAAQAKPAVNEDDLFQDNDRISRLEEMIESLAEKLNAPPPAPAGTPLMERVMEKLLLEKLEGNGNNPMQQPEVIGAMIKNALEVQTKLLIAREDLKIEDHRLERDLKMERATRQLDREELAFQAKQKLLIENARAITGESTFDPQGGNTLSLLEAIQDIIGAKGNLQIFGVNLADVLEPIVPQITKALQDRGIYVLAKTQLEQLLKHQYEQGQAIGQQQALEELTGPETPEETANGPDGGTGISRPEDNPGPDDQAGSPEGSGGEPEA